MMILLQRNSINFYMLARPRQPVNVVIHISVERSSRIVKQSDFPYNTVAARVFTALTLSDTQRDDYLRLSKQNKFADKRCRVARRRKIFERAVGSIGRAEQKRHLFTAIHIFLPYSLLSACEWIARPVGA